MSKYSKKNFELTFVKTNLYTPADLEENLGGGGRAGHRAPKTDYTGLI